MMPERSLSTTPVIGPFLVPEGGSASPLIDYEMGGIALRDASQGLQVQVWTFYLDGDNVMCDAPSVSPTVLFTRAGITELSGCFDQNMNPCVAFVAAGVTTLWWFDSVVHAQVFTIFTGYSPKVTLDDKRELQDANSDIIFAYLRGSTLYNRTQRDRFTVEDMLYSPIDSSKYKFKAMGMNSINRLQFLFVPVADT